MQIQDFVIADLSSGATSWIPAVPSGLTFAGFFRDSQARSLLNWVGSTPSTVSLGTPTFPATGSTGVLVSGLNRVTLPVEDTADFTLFLVAGCPGANSVDNWFIVGSNNGFEGSKGFALFTGASVYSISAVAWFADSSSVAQKLQLSYTNDQSSDSYAIIQQPRLYKIKVDSANQLFSFDDLTTPYHRSQSFPAGYVRSNDTVPVNLGGDVTGWAGNTLAHALLLYNRATTAYEDGLIVAQLRSAMSARGVTV